MEIKEQKEWGLLIGRIIGLSVILFIMIIILLIKKFYPN